MTHHTISVNKTAHFFALGEPGPHIRQLWIVCHGYAQNADEFLQNFKVLDPSNTLVIAPEGFNHFYKKGFGGEPAANWMTSRFREAQIEDYAGFLQKIYEHFVPQLPEHVRIVLFGFSQGTATVCRWMLRHTPHFHDLLLWAGLPPEDLDFKAHKDYFATKSLYLLYGTTDPFLTPDRMAMVNDIEEKNDIDFAEKQFTGGHEIPEAALRSFVGQLN